MDNPEKIQRWQEYQQRTAGGKPRPLLQEALQYVQRKGNALDLGAGALNDASFLVEQGFGEVVAVDITPPFKAIDAESGQFSYRQMPFSAYEFPAEHFDLISAQYSLPFDNQGFQKVWKNIYGSLKKGGIFVGQLFSARDDWFGRSGMIFHSEAEVQSLSEQFEIIKQEEREYTEKEERAKHWHYFDLILMKSLT